MADTSKATDSQSTDLDLDSLSSNLDTDSLGDLSSDLDLDKIGDLSSNFGDILEPIAKIVSALA